MHPLLLLLAAAAQASPATLAEALGGERAPALAVACGSISALSTVTGGRSMALVPMTLPTVVLAV